MGYIFSVQTPAFYEYANRAVQPKEDYAKVKQRNNVMMNEEYLHFQRKQDLFANKRKYSKKRFHEPVVLVES